MTNAYDYWGVAAGCSDADVNSVAGGCNGNGNGQIVSSTEGFRLWQHMNLAGVYDGSFTGVPSGGFMAISVFFLLTGLLWH